MISLRQKVRKGTNTDGVAPSLPACYQASTIRILPAGGGTRPAFSNPTPHSEEGREALTLEVSEQGATHMAHSDVGVQACPRYQYQIVRAAD